MTDLELRTVPESDIERVLDLAGVVFHHAFKDEGERERGRWMPRRCEMLGMYDAGALIGQLGWLDVGLSVPAGTLDCAGVTYVGVLPTHRRRGVLSALMDQCFADAAGRPLAALWASQRAIYGRYGYGTANRAISLEIDSSRPLEFRIEPDPRPLRLVPLADAPGVLAPLYGRARARRAGQLARDADWWEHAVLPPTDDDGPEYGPPQVVVLDGEPGGYAIYRTRSGQDFDEVAGVVRVEELEGDTPAVEAALWRYLGSIDLSTRIVSPSRPADDLLPLLAADGDQVAITRDWGALWVRLLDLPAALSGRGWAAADSLVLEVEDTRVPANQGRWRLDTGDATCTRTDDAPDLTLRTAELGAVYLGDTPAHRLARAGLITEHTPAAATRLDTALAVPLAPYTADQF